ncbi:MAG: hypothetical protein HOP11_01745 [Saprospiraceae bacterium]|nr:hypothetical protein [Saprospiraceae bacterium]
MMILISCYENIPEPSNRIRYGDGSRTKVEGMVKEYGTGRPIVHALVILDEGIQTGFFTGNINWYPEDSVYTDSLGHYVFEFKHKPYVSGREEYFSYQLRCDYPNYFGIAPKLVATSWWFKDLDLILDPYAWIKVHIKNVNPYDEHDYILTSIEGGGGIILEKKLIY